MLKRVSIGNSARLRRLTIATIHLVVLGEDGKVGDKEQVVEEFNSAGFAMGLEDRYGINPRMTVGIAELHNPLVHVHFIFRRRALPSGRGHGYLVKGRCGPGDMFAADQRFVRLCPAKDVRELHGEDGLQIILRQIQENDCIAELARNCKLRQKRR